MSRKQFVAHYDTIQIALNFKLNFSSFVASAIQFSSFFCKDDDDNLKGDRSLRRKP
jgi:hypothetical protein